MSIDDLNVSQHELEGRLVLTRMCRDIRSNEGHPQSLPPCNSEDTQPCLSEQATEHTGLDCFHTVPQAVARK